MHGRVGRRDMSPVEPVTLLYMKGLMWQIITDYFGYLLTRNPNLTRALYDT